MTIQQEFKNASMMLDNERMHIWLYENKTKLGRAGINIHPQRYALGKKLKETTIESVKRVINY